LASASTAASGREEPATSLPLTEVGAALVGVLVINAAANFVFLRLSGRIGQDALMDLRKMLFAHVQELSLSFYER